MEMDFSRGFASAVGVLGVFECFPAGWLAGVSVSPSGWCLRPRRLKKENPGFSTSTKEPLPRLRRTRYMSRGSHDASSYASCKRPTMVKRIVSQRKPLFMPMSDNGIAMMESTMPHFFATDTAQRRINVSNQSWICALCRGFPWDRPRRHA